MLLVTRHSLINAIILYMLHKVTCDTTIVFIIIYELLPTDICSILYLIFRKEEKKKEALKIEKINDGRSSLETKDVGNIEYDEEKKPRTSVSDKHAEMKGVKRKERSGESSEDTEPRRKSKKKKKSSFKKGKKSKKRQSSSSSSSSNDSTNNSSSSGSSSSGKDRRKRQKEKKLKKSLKRLKKEVKQLKKRSTSSSPETSGVREVKRMLESQRKYQVEMIV